MTVLTHIYIYMSNLELCKIIIYIYTHSILTYDLLHNIYCPFNT